ncbi:MAG: hypothetical protein JXR13_04190 [Thalassovita sp.]
MFQGNSKKQRSSNSELDLEVQKNFTIFPEEIDGIFGLFRTDLNIDRSQQYLLPSLTDPDRTMVRGPLLQHYIDQGCLPIGSEEVKFYGTSSFFYLAESSQCFVRAYSKLHLAAKNAQNIPFPHKAYREMNKFAHSNPPSEKSTTSTAVVTATTLPSDQKPEYLMAPPSGVEYTTRSMWASFAPDVCRNRKTDDGDWIVLQYKPINENRSENVLAHAFHEHRLLNYHVEFFKAAGWVGPGSWSFSSDKGCRYPKSLQIRVYYGDKLIASTRLDRAYIRANDPDKDFITRDVGSYMNSYRLFSKFLVEEIGEKIWLYAENFR